jgi:paraquat-inducible protein B
MSVSSPEIAGPKSGRRRFAWIWLAPIAATAIAAYLGYAGLAGRGPLITIDFTSADGLTAGQTEVRHKSVPIGVVQSVKLTDDFARIRVAVRMQPEVASRLTEGARFWVVRPRLRADAISGLETLVSGAYIEFDPGSPDGARERDFQGLNEPPGIRSGEPGRAFTVRTRRPAGLRPGSAVLFRGVAAGEVASVDPLASDGEVALRVFIRAPYDSYVRAGSRFWSTSGITTSVGANGFRVEVESLQAALTGGIAFDTPSDQLDLKPLTDDPGFPLYDNEDVAITATSPKRLEFMTYLDGSASGLGIGAPVEIFGIRVGSVTNIDLVYDVARDRFVVPVRFVVEPGHIVSADSRPPVSVEAAVARLVAEGYRVRPRTGNLITGQKTLAIDRIPGAPPAEVRVEGGVLVLPAAAPDGDMMDAAAAVATKIDRLPLDEIARNLNTALASLNTIVQGPELRGAMSQLPEVLARMRDLLRNADDGLSPLLKRQLPALFRSLDRTARDTGSAVRSIEAGYGTDSTFDRRASQALMEVSDAARAVRQLVDLLERHPEALVRGRPE